VTVQAGVFARVQMVQKVEETLNKFRRTRLVSSMVGICMKWEVRRVGGQGDWHCGQCCVCKDPEGSKSWENTKRVQTNSFSE